MSSQRCNRSIGPWNTRSLDVPVTSSNFSINEIQIRVYEIRVYEIRVYESQRQNHTGGRACQCCNVINGEKVVRACNIQKVYGQNQHKSRIQSKQKHRVIVAEKIPHSSRRTLTEDCWIPHRIKQRLVIITIRYTQLNQWCRYYIYFSSVAKSARSKASTKRARARDHWGVGFTKGS